GGPEDQANFLGPVHPFGSLAALYRPPSNGLRAHSFAPPPHGGVVLIADGLVVAASFPPRGRQHAQQHRKRSPSLPTMQTAIWKFCGNTALLTKPLAGKKLQTNSFPKGSAAPACSSWRE